jgi:transcriptional regulator with XRE-family HTH domain
MGDDPGKHVPRDHRLNRRVHGRSLDPLVRALLIEIDASHKSMESVSLRAGLSKDSIGAWARGNRTPNIANIRAALGVFGIVLVAIKPRKLREVHH